MRRFMFVPVVVTFGYLFRGVQAFCVRSQNVLQLFCVIFNLAPINRHWWTCLSRLVAGTDVREYLLISVSVFCLCSLSEVSSCCFVCHVCGTRCMHRVEVIFNVFSFFFCYVIIEKAIIIVLSQQIVQGFKQLSLSPYSLMRHHSLWAGRRTNVHKREQVGG